MIDDGGYRSVGRPECVKPAHRVQILRTHEIGSVCVLPERAGDILCAPFTAMS